MLGDKDAIATIAIKDVNVAKKFYEGMLGLKPNPAEEPGVLSYKSGNSMVLVYKSQYAGTNKATAATWSVGDNIEGVVQALKAKGVESERSILGVSAHLLGIGRKTGASRHAASKTGGIAVTSWPL